MKEEGELYELSLFSGIGGGALGSRLLGFRVVGYVEISDYCQRVLRARMLDGSLDPAPIFSDIHAFVDSRAVSLYRGVADVVSAGFPCPAFSRAGLSGGFKQDPLFYDTLEVISAVEPSYVLFENVEGFTRWADTLRFEVQNLGYEWADGIFNSLDFGVPQNRPRYFSLCVRQKCLPVSAPPLSRKASKDLSRILSLSDYGQRRRASSRDIKAGWRDILSRAGRRRGPVRAPHRMDRLRAVGNVQVPSVAAGAWRILIRVLAGDDY
jgi:DNA (cytosine-5)-methyltransferase 1